MKPKETLSLLFICSPEWRQMVESKFTDHHFHAFFCSDEIESRGVLEKSQVDAVLLPWDFLFEGESAAKVLSMELSIPVLTMTDEPLADRAIELIQDGVADILRFDTESAALLEILIYRSVKNYWLQEAAIHSRQELKQSHFEIEQAFELLAEDQHSALQVQRRLRPPSDIRIGDYFLSYAVYPSQWLSGDFLHYLELNDDEVLVYLGDVSGHGASSALVGIVINHLAQRWVNVLRSSGESISPSELIKAINAELVAMNMGKHSTLLMVRVSRQTGEVCFASAGHFPHLLKVGGGEGRYVPAKGQPVGLFPHIHIEEEHFVLSLGETLVLSSDGVFDLQNEGNISLKDKENVFKNLVVSSLEKKVSAECVFSAFALPEGHQLADDVAVLLVHRSEDNIAL